MSRYWGWATNKQTREATIGVTGPMGPGWPNRSDGFNLRGISALWHQWHLTPWWCFWRPKWRRWPGHIECDWEFASDQQRARQVLEEECGNGRR